MRTMSIQWLIKIRKGNTWKNWLYLWFQQEADEGQPWTGRKLASSKLLRDLRVWKNLGPAEKPNRGHPRMPFLQAQHFQIDPLGWPSPDQLLQAGTQTHGQALSCWLLCSLPAKLKTSSILQDTVVLWPWQMGTNQPAHWCHWTVREQSS